MDDSGTYVLCDFGSATPRFLNPQKQNIKDIEEELQRSAHATVLLLIHYYGVILRDWSGMMLWLYIALTASWIMFNCASRKLPYTLWGIKMWQQTFVNNSGKS